MTTVKLKIPVQVGLRIHAEGETVLVPDDRARSMIAEGLAGPSDEPAVNAKTANPLADTLTPIPHGAIPVNPADALSPHVGDNPGLSKLVEVTGQQDQVSPTGRASTIPPVPTADVAHPDAVAESHELANPRPSRTAFDRPSAEDAAAKAKVKPTKAPPAVPSAPPVDAKTS